MKGVPKGRTWESTKRPVQIEFEKHLEKATIAPSCSVSSSYQGCSRDLCAAMPNQRFLPAMVHQPVGAYTGPVWVCLLLATLVCGNQSWKKCPGPPLVNCSRATSCCANIGESLDIWISSSITRFDFCKCNASRCWLAYTFSKVTSVNYTNDFQGQATVKQGTFHAPEVSKGDVGSYRFFNMDDNTCLLKVDIELPGAAVWPSCTILLLLLSLVTSVVF
ncbi:hypothetical protein Y1Q_0018172 [Alligator mississippiensis]|uniref:Uncharacterized protein n=1 Tax=Alligator mississippiensis TaxID=8496 RepID=A0A151MRH5_ALLMI|nr:hypothetical protein Y1Q_0018172 [Alligator mississippiensis]